MVDIAMETAIGTHVLTKNANDYSYLYDNNAGSGVNFSSPMTVNVIVSAGALPELVFADASVTVSHTETDASSNLVLDLTSTKPIAAGEKVNVAIAVVGAGGTVDASSADYTDVTEANLSVGTAHTITIPINGDLLVEPSEVFMVTLTAEGSNYTVGRVDVSTVTITDNDTATLTASQTTTGTISVGDKVALAGTLDRQVSVGSSTDKLTFSDATNSANIVFTDTDGDGLLNGTELTAGVGEWTATGAGATKTLTFVAIAPFPNTLTGAKFTGDDLAVVVAPPAVPELSVADLSIPEGETGNVIVTLSAPAAGAAVTGTYRLSSADSRAGTDYTEPNPQRFSIAVGKSTMEIPIPTFPDNIIEGDETLTLTLLVSDDTSKATLAGGDGARATITIVDDDDDDARLRIALIPASGSATELTTPDAQQTVKLKAFLHKAGNIATVLRTSKEITVKPTAFGGAWGGTTAPDPFTIAVNASDGVSKNFIIGSVAASDTPIPAPTFAPDIGTFVSPGSAVASVAISLPAKPVLSVPSTESVSEGSDVTITVAIAPTTRQDVEGKFTYIAGTAGAADYSGEGGVFTIFATDPDGAFQVATPDDEIVEAEETFTFTITADDPALADVSATAGTTTVTINDDDIATLTASVATTGDVFVGDTVALTGVLDKRVAVGTLTTLTFRDATNNASIVFTDDNGDGLLNSAERMRGVGTWVATDANATKTLNFVAVAPFPVGMTVAKFTGDTADVVVASGARSLSFSFIESAGTPRSWAYVHPIEVTGTAQTITLELSSAPATNVVFNLAASVEGIPDGEQAKPAENVYTLPNPATLTVTGDGTNKTGTASITIDPDAQNGLQRFYVVATPVVPNVYDAGAAGRVEFVVNADHSSKDPGGLGADFAYHPRTLTIEQGSFDTFQVINLSGADNPTQDILNVLVNNNVAPPLPAGIELHWQTATPKPRPDRSAALGSAGDVARIFGFPTPKNNGDSVQVLVNVTNAATKKSHVLTLDGDDINYYLGFGSTYFTTTSPLTVVVVEGTGTPPAIPELAFVAASVTASYSEADANVVLDLESTAPLDAGEKVNVAITAVGAGDTVDASSADYADVTEASLSAGTTHRITIPIVGDMIVEPDEVFMVTLTAEGSAYTTGGADVSTVTIIDNDTATLMASQTTTGTISVGDEVALAGRLDRQVAVGSSTDKLTFSDATNKASIVFTDTDGDGLLKGGELTAGAGVWTATDAGETKTLNFVAVAPFPNALTAAKFTGDDLAVVVEGTGTPPAIPELAFASASVTVTHPETDALSNLVLALESTGALAAGEKVNVAIAVVGADGTVDASPADYTGLTEAPLAVGTAHTITIPIMGDLIVEPSEVFMVTLTAEGSAYTIGGAGVSTVTITDNDIATLTPTITGDIIANTAVTGLAGTLDNPVAIADSATLTFRDATNGADIVFTEANNNGLLDGDELTGVGTWTAGAAGQTTLTFVAVAPFPAGIAAAKFAGGAALTVTVAPAVVAPPVAPVGPQTFSFIDSADTPRTWAYVHPYEVSGTTQTITLELSVAPTSDVVFNLATNTDDIPAGEAAVAGVYPNLPATLTVTGDGTNKVGMATITLDPSHASIGGKVKRFYVVATPPAGYEAGAADRVEFAVGLPTAGNFDAIAFYPNELTIEQGGSDSFAVINLRGGTNPQGFLALPDSKTYLPAGITVTSPDSTSVSGPDDQFGIQGPEADGSSLSIMVDIAMETAIATHVLTKNEEDYSYLYDNTLGGAINFHRPMTVKVIAAGSTSPPVVTPPAALPTVEFASAAVTTAENKTIKVGVTISTMLASDSTINLAFSEDTDPNTFNAKPAAGGGDHAYPGGATFVLPAGETTAEISIPISDSAKNEPDEVLVVTMSAIDSAPYVIGDQDTFTITITGTGTEVAKLQIALVADSDTSKEITEITEQGLSVRLKASVVQDLVFTTVPHTITEDITVTPGEFSGAWGTTVPPDAFTIPAESIAEGVFSEPFTIASTGGTMVIPAPTFAPDVKDFKSADDILVGPEITLPAPATVPELSVADTRIEEGEAGNVRVTLTANAAAEITGTYTLVATDAEATDYTDPSPKTFAIAKDASFVDIPLTTLEDQIVEPPETLTLTIASDSSAAATLKTGEESATVTITDDDTATLTASVTTTGGIFVSDTVALAGTLDKQVAVGTQATLTFTDATNSANIVFTDSDGNGVLDDTERAAGVGEWTATDAGATKTLTFVAVAPFPAGMTVAKFTGDTADVVVVPGARPLTFNIIDSPRVPRVVPYIYPFDIASVSTQTQTKSADAAMRNPAVTQTLTIETSQPAPAGGWQFALAASEAGIASGEVAPPASYTVPATLTIDAGDSTGMVDITLTPSALSAAPHNFYPITMYLTPQAAGRTYPTGAVRRFVVEATPPTGVASGVGQVGFAFANSVGISQRVGSERFIGYSSSLVEVEQGGVASFRVINASRMAGQAPVSGTLTYPLNAGELAANPPAAVPLPTGVSFHFRTMVPKATPDVASGANFALPGPGAEGESALVLVQAAVDAPLSADEGVLLLKPSTDTYGNERYHMKADAHGKVTMNSPFRIKVIAPKDAPAAVPELSVADTRIDEGGTAMVRVTSSAPATADIAGSYTLVATDAEATDYTDPTTKTFTIAKDADFVDIPITTSTDTILEFDETLTLTIASTDTATLKSGEESAIVTITDITNKTAKLRVALVASNADTTEILTAGYNQAVKLRAFLHKDGDSSVAYRTDREIMVTPADFDDKWGDTPTPAPFLIPPRGRGGLSAEFRILSRVAGPGRIPPLAFAPEFGGAGGFESPGDSAQSAEITLPVAPAAAAVDFNFIDSPGVERALPYIHPYEIRGASNSGTLTHTITLELSAATGADVDFPLSASSEGIGTGERVTGTAFHTIPATLTVPKGSTTGTAMIGIDPAALTGTRRFYVVVAPPDGSSYQAGDTDRVEFVVNAEGSKIPRITVGFYPIILTIPQGGSGTLIVINSATSTLARPSGFLTNSSVIPTGITLTSPGGFVAAPGQPFKIDAPAGVGESLAIRVDVAEGTTPDTYLLTGTGTFAKIFASTGTSGFFFSNIVPTIKVVAPTTQLEGDIGRLAPDGLQCGESRQKSGYSGWGSRG
ncbi:MAG: hypothetical protein OD811_06615 [Alphaproteobacteria bacterium]